MSFLALDEISVLPRDGVLAVLDEAAADPDEVCLNTHIGRRNLTSIC